MSHLSIARDAMVLVGAALVVAGVALYSAPAGFIVSGVFLLTAGLVGVLRA